MATYRETQLQLRRQAIVAAARRCFTQKTYAAATMPDVAKEAGMTLKTITAQFPEKEDLMRAVAHTIMSDRIAQFEALTTQRPVLPPAELVAGLSKLVGVRSQAPLRIQAWAVFLFDEELESPVAEYMAAVDDMLIAYAREWLESIGRTPAEAEERAPSVATTLIVLLNGILLQVAMDPSMSLGRFVDAARQIDFAPPRPEPRKASKPA